MQIFRLFFISAVLLFLVVTAISLLIPSRVRISRATNVNAAPTAIWRQVDDIYHWQEWNPFFSGTIAGKINYNDTVGGKPVGMEINGTTISWKEKNAAERIVTMDKKGFKQFVSGWNCITHPGSDSTTVQWYLDFQLRWYPWEKFSSLLFEKSYGVQLEQGLNNLKKLAEANR